jgi:hypothetical protein
MWLNIVLYVLICYILLTVLEHAAPRHLKSSWVISSVNFELQTNTSEAHHQG